MERVDEHVPGAVRHCKLQRGDIKLEMYDCAAICLCFVLEVSFWNAGGV